MAVRYINRWYKINHPGWLPEHDQARIHILEGMIHAYILSGQHLFQKHKGMTSGFVLTALLNSLCNMIIHLLWFLASIPALYRHLSFYDDYVVTKIYGDDSIDAVSDQMSLYLNRSTYAAFCDTYLLMKITSSLKDGSNTDTQPILELTFLKRGFRIDGFLVKPILDVKSLISMICFVRTSNYATLEDQLIVNIRVFLQFAYFHGLQYFTRFRNYFMACFPILTLPSYNYYDSMFCFGHPFNLTW